VAQEVNLATFMQRVETQPFHTGTEVEDLNREFFRKVTSLGPQLHQHLPRWWSEVAERHSAL